MQSFDTLTTLGYTVTEPECWPTWLRRTFVLTLPVSVPIWVVVCWVAVVVYLLAIVVVLLCDWIMHLPRSVPNWRQLPFLEPLRWIGRVWRGESGNDRRPA